MTILADFARCGVFMKVMLMTLSLLGC